MFCALAGHRPSSETIENDGHVFTRCARCAADLVQVHGRWQTAPAGFRIVWRRAPAEALPASPVEPETAPVEAPAAVQAIEPETLDLDIDTLDLQAEAIVLEAEAMLDEAMVEEPLQLIQESAPEERRWVDRRAPPGTQPVFTGVDRRRGDRRGSFGRNRRPGPAAPAAEPAAEVQ